MPCPCTAFPPRGHQRQPNRQPTAWRRRCWSCSWRRRAATADPRPLIGVQDDQAPHTDRSAPSNRRLWPPQHGLELVGRRALLMLIPIVPRLPTELVPTCKQGACTQRLNCNWFVQHALLGPGSLFATVSEELHDLALLCGRRDAAENAPVEGAGDAPAAVAAAQNTSPSALHLPNSADLASARLGCVRFLRAPNLCCRFLCAFAVQRQTQRRNSA